MVPRYILDAVQCPQHTQGNTQKNLPRPIPTPRATTRFLVHRDCRSRCACTHMLDGLLSLVEACKIALCFYIHAFVCPQQLLSSLRSFIDGLSCPMPSFKPQKWRKLRALLGKSVVKKVFVDGGKAKSVLGVLKKFIISGFGLDEKVNVTIDQALKVAHPVGTCSAHPEGVFFALMQCWPGHRGGAEAIGSRRQLPSIGSE